MVKYNIYHADSFDWLSEKKAKSVHGIVTDPPYGIKEYDFDQIEKRESGNGGVWRLPQEFDGNKRSPSPRFTILNEADHERISEFHSDLAPLLRKVLVPGGHVIIASNNLLSYHVINAFLTAGFELRGQIVRTVKTLRGGDRPKGAHKEYAEVSVIPRAGWEPWLIFRKRCEGRVKDNLKKWYTGALRRPSINNPFWDIIKSRPANRDERKIAPHPSLKPQAFIRQIVRAVLPLGKGVVLDPFMGSGSTIAAAEYLNLKSIGIEVRDEYFELAEASIPLLSTYESNGSEL